MTLGCSIGHPDLYSSGGSLILKDQHDRRRGPRLEYSAQISIVTGATDINRWSSHSRVGDPDKSPGSIPSQDITMVLVAAQASEIVMVPWSGHVSWKLTWSHVLWPRFQQPIHRSLEVTRATDIETDLTAS